MMAGMERREELRAMLTGFRLSAALSVAAELGLSDLLAAGPRSLAELASAASADEDTLGRLLHALVTVGVYAELPDASYALTSLGEGLRSDVPGSMRPLARTLQDPDLWAAWSQLAQSVRTGENAFEALHGIDVWTHRQQNPAHNAIFNDNMTSLASLVADAVANTYDFSSVASVVDVGGGHGLLLEAVLSRHPHLTGVVFDQSHVVATAPRPGATESVASRWAAASGSFFESVPAADCLLLKAILHDWPDDRSVAILRVCREALTEGGVVLVLETVLGRPGYEVDAAFSDLNMLVLPGGRERTEAQYAALFEASGLRLRRVVDTGTRLSILEATA
jgi:hypothetical protein